MSSGSRSDRLQASQMCCDRTFEHNLIFKLFKLLWFSSKVAIVVVRSLGSFEILSRLLLMLAELLLLRNCWMTNKIWSASIVARYSHCQTVNDLWSAPSFVFLKFSHGAIGIHFLNSCFHMKSLVWVWSNWMTWLIDRRSHFTMETFLGTILMWFLVFHVWVPEHSRNGSGACPY